MKNIFWIGALALSTLNGCIYYEGGHFDDDDMNDWDDWDDWDGNDDNGDIVGGGGGGGAQAPWTFEPNYIEPGETQIVYVTPNADQSIHDCTDVQVFGDCGLMAFELGEDSITLVVTMDADADEACDVLLDLGDDGVEFIDDAIHPGGLDVCEDPPADEPPPADNGSDGSSDDPFEDCP